jgi:hypothetical protein
MTIITNLDLEEVDLRRVTRKRKNHDLESEDHIEAFLTKYSLLRTVLPKRPAPGNRPPSARRSTSRTLSNVASIKDEIVNGHGDNDDDQLSIGTLVVDERNDDTEDDDDATVAGSFDLFPARESSSGYHSLSSNPPPPLPPLPRPGTPIPPLTPPATPAPPATPPATPAPAEPIAQPRLRRPEDFSPRRLPFSATPYTENRLRGSIRNSGPF